MAVLFALTIPGLVLGLLALALLDRSLSGKRGQRHRPSAAGLELLHATFSPSKEHQLRQRQTELLWREDEDEGAPPRSHIDLDRGVAQIVRPLSDG